MYGNISVLSESLELYAQVQEQIAKFRPIHEHDLHTYSLCSPLDITIPGLSVEEETYIRDQLKLLPALSPAMLVRYDCTVDFRPSYSRSIYSWINFEFRHIVDK